MRAPIKITLPIFASQHNFRFVPVIDRDSSRNLYTEMLTMFNRLDQIKKVKLDTPIRGFEITYSKFFSARERELIEYMYAMENSLAFTILRANKCKLARLVDILSLLLPYNAEEHGKQIMWTMSEIAWDEMSCEEKDLFADWWYYQPSQPKSWDEVFYHMLRRPAYIIVYPSKYVDVDAIDESPMEEIKGGISWRTYEMKLSISTYFKQWLHNTKDVDLSWPLTLYHGITQKQYDAFNKGSLVGITIELD